MWGDAKGVRIVNLLTQAGGYDRGSRPEKANLKHVRESLRSLVKMVKKESFTSIAIPKLATGVGGLDWKDVKPLIEEKLGELDIPVYVYSEFHTGQQAAEPGL